MTKTILLLEDDFLQRRDVKTALEQEFGAEVDAISCEEQFREKFETIALAPPQIAVLDIMVRWTNASRNEQAVPEDAQEPAYAGIRCARMLQSDPRTSHTRVILYSVLDKDNLSDAPPEGIMAVVKESNFQNLIDAVSEANRAWEVETS